MLLDKFFKSKRYEEMFRTKDTERALKRYNTDKELLDADSVNFRAIDDMDIGERYLVSYDMPVIVPISEILWIRFMEVSGKTYMWTLVSDGYCQLLLVNDKKNFKKIFLTLLSRNNKFIYGENNELKLLFRSNADEFYKLISRYPNEDAKNIKVDTALLPESEPEKISEAKGGTKTVKEPITPYVPPKKQDLDSVVIPDNLPFAEEMKMFLHLAKKYPDELYLKFYEPLSDYEIEKFESENNIKLTDELKMLFSFTNGFSVSVGHIEIYPIEIIKNHLNVEWEWGDTKKYLYLGDRIGDGEIILLDLDTGNILTNDHGKQTDYGDITALLSESIFTFLDGEFDDDELNAYINSFETTEH